VRAHRRDGDRFHRPRRWAPALVLRPAPDERDRALWRRFASAEQTQARLEHAIRRLGEALDAERHALARAQAEFNTLATQPFPVTIEEEAKGTRAGAVGRYRALHGECQEREAAIVELGRLLRAPEQIRDQLTEAVARLLEAVVAVDREAVVRRVGAELEPIRAWFARLGTAADAHESKIAEWNKRVGRLRVPRIAFSWPPAAAWRALLDEAAEAPTLVWDADSESPRT
jgi:chromosome segregation ATPase